MKCVKHPKYKAIYKPRCDCKMCWYIWKLKYRKKIRQKMYERWNKIKALRAIKRSKNKKEKMTKTKTYTLISPQGKQYTTDNLTKFANRFKNLTRSGLSKIANGHQMEHKGWRSA